METREQVMPLIKETVPVDKGEWKNLFGEDVRLVNRNAAYEPKPQSLVNENGFSVVSPDCFLRQAMLEPVRERQFTTMTVPLDKIVAIDTTPNVDARNRDPNRLPWEIASHGSVQGFRKLIREGKFNFNDIDGLYGLELPGGYMICDGGRHRVTAMFLEGLKEATFRVKKVVPNEFLINYFYENTFYEDKLRQALQNSDIKGRIEEIDGDKKLILDSPTIKNPLQLFADSIPEELIDVMTQTLPTESTR
jgi:hypothetical protein